MQVHSTGDSTVRFLLRPLLAILLLTALPLSAQQLPHDQRLTFQPLYIPVLAAALQPVRAAVTVGRTTMVIWATSLFSDTSHRALYNVLIAQAIRDGASLGHPDLISDKSSAPTGGLTVRAAGDRFMAVWNTASSQCLRMIDSNGGTIGPVLYLPASFASLSASSLSILPGDSLGPAIMGNLGNGIGLATVDTVHWQIVEHPAVAEPWYDDTLVVRRAGPQLERSVTGWWLRYGNGQLDPRPIPLSRLDGSIAFRLDDDTTLTRTTVNGDSLIVEFYSSVFDSIAQERRRYVIPPAAPGHLVPLRSSVFRYANDDIGGVLCYESIYSVSQTGFFDYYLIRYRIGPSDTIAIVDTAGSLYDHITTGDPFGVNGTMTDGFGCRVVIQLGAKRYSFAFGSQGSEAENDLTNRWYEDALSQVYPFSPVATTHVDLSSVSALDVALDSLGQSVRLVAPLDGVAPVVTSILPSIGLSGSDLLLGWQETQPVRSVRLAVVQRLDSFTLVNARRDITPNDEQHSNYISPVEYSSSSLQYSDGTAAVPGVAWRASHSVYRSHGMVHQIEMRDGRSSATGWVGTPAGWVPVVESSTIGEGQEAMLPVVTSGPDPGGGFCTIINAVRWNTSCLISRFSDESVVWKRSVDRLNITDLVGLVGLDSNHLLLVLPDRAVPVTDGVVETPLPLLVDSVQTTRSVVALGYDNTWLRLNPVGLSFRLERYAWPATLINSLDVGVGLGAQFVFHSSSKIIGLMWPSPQGVRISLFDRTLRPLLDTVVNADGQYGTEFPSAVFLGDTLYAVWGDRRDGTREIYANRWVLPANVKEAAGRAAESPRGDTVVDRLDTVEHHDGSDKVAGALTGEIRVVPQPAREEMTVSFVASRQGEGMLELVDNRGAVVWSTLIFPR